MDTPENYYAILGVPMDADDDTLKRAYRQLARRYHPDLAGSEGAVQMKRINRAYAVLSDAEQRLNYDTIIGGTLDLRKSGLARPRPIMRKFSTEDDIEFAGLSIFSTRGPLKTGARLQSRLGVISVLKSSETPQGLLIAAGSLDGRGLCWLIDTTQEPVNFAVDAEHPIESLRELRFSAGGALLGGWGRLGLHVWKTSDGTQLWNYSLEQRAVSAHYSVDMVLQEQPAQLWLALPLQSKDALAPRAYGVRGTNVVAYTLKAPVQPLSEPLNCVEDEVENRRFWAIRLRALAQDRRTLLTLSCANVPGETEQMIILRRWDLTSKARFSTKNRPQIRTAIMAGLCAECTPPYAITADTRLLAFVYTENMLRLHDTLTGTYSQFSSGSMGASSRLAISPNGAWIAVAREDSEINEGVVDLWSAQEEKIIQKLYHPWQVSALHFADQQLVVALTDGTIQTWKS